MRKAILFIVLSTLCAAIYSGDVANFVDLGFSPDGKTFAFGQYGVEEKTLSTYGELFFVDVVKNSFIPGANLSSPPGASKQRTASAVFEQLKSKAAPSMRRLSIDNNPENRTSRLIYTEDIAAPPNKGLEMHFRDFETEKTYEVSLHQTASGTGFAVSSSFYITAKITGADGRTQTLTTGNPTYKRKGVIGYRISRILTDSSNRAVVFVVEKEMYSPGGNSIRYMVETLYL